MMLLVGMVLGICLFIFIIMVAGFVITLKMILNVIKKGRTHKITRTQNQLNETLKMGVLEELQKGTISIEEFNNTIEKL